MYFLIQKTIVLSITENEGRIWMMAAGRQESRLQ
jgi:hypothetical protein